MVFSESKPSEILILETKNDVRKGKVYVKYSFRYNIKESTREDVYIDDTGTEQKTTISGYEYNEYIGDQEFDIVLRPSIPELLKGEYTAMVPILQYSQLYADYEIPKEITVNQSN